MNGPRTADRADQRVDMAVGAHEVSLSFGETQALDNVSLDIDAGEVVALMGPSGSGKSTLLHCLAGVLTPDRGEIRVGGSQLTRLSEQERCALRLSRMGFVFQFGDLIPELTLHENVMLPLQLNGVGTRDAKQRADAVLRSLEIDEVAGRRAGSVAGGQAQRAAVARAIVHRPSVVFADEPTGSLDTVNGELVLDALVQLSKDEGTTLIIVTHDNRVASCADRLISLRDGSVVVPVELAR